MKIIKINESYLNSENLKILNTLGFSTNDSREILKNLSLISNKSYKLVFLSVSILFIISAIIIPLFILEYKITCFSSIFILFAICVIINFIFYKKTKIQNNHLKFIINNQINYIQKTYYFKVSFFGEIIGNIFSSNKLPMLIDKSETTIEYSYSKIDESDVNEIKCNKDEKLNSKVNLNNLDLVGFNKNILNSTIRNENNKKEFEIEKFNKSDYIDRIVFFEDYVPIKKYSEKCYQTKNYLLESEKEIIQAFWETLEKFNKQSYINYFLFSTLLIEVILFSVIIAFSEFQINFGGNDDLEIFSYVLFLTIFILVITITTFLFKRKKDKNFELFFENENKQIFTTGYYVDSNLLAMYKIRRSENETCTKYIPSNSSGSIEIEVKNKIVLTYQETKILINSFI